MDDHKREKLAAEDNILTPVQAAEILGVRARTLRHWRECARGPSYLRLGAAVRYLRSDVLRWAAAQRVEPGAA